MIKQMGKTEQQCLEAETEYRDWKDCPLWYCVKTLFNIDTGKMESEIVRDKKTKQMIAIKDTAKPLDGVYETPAGAIYYTYHRGYAEAVNQVAAINRQIQQTFSIIYFTYFTTATRRLFLCLKSYWLLNTSLPSVVSR